METANGFLGKDFPVAGDDACHIDGEKAAAADGAGKGKDEECQCQHKDRCQASVGSKTVDYGNDHQPAQQAEDQPKAHLFEEKNNEASVEPGKPLAFADHLDKGDGQEDRHGIVGAGLDFERRTHLIADMYAADAEQEEDGCRIRRGNDRAKQQALKPG